MQTVAEPKAVKEISPGMKRINEMFQGKSAAKPRATGPVDAGLSSVSASSAGGVGAASIKRKVDAANIEVDDLLCGLDKDLAGASTVKKKKVLPASRPAPRQPGALFPPSGRAPGKRRVPITPDSLLTKAGVSLAIPPNGMRMTCGSRQIYRYGFDSVTRALSMCWVCGFACVCAFHFICLHARACADILLRLVVARCAQGDLMPRALDNLPGQH
jgi:hypothetical protein